MAMETKTTLLISVPKDLLSLNIMGVQNKQPLRMHDDLRSFEDPESHAKEKERLFHQIMTLQHIIYRSKLKIENLQFRLNQL